MRKTLLDRDTLSEITKGVDQTVVENATRYLDEHGVLTFTSVSVYELLWGYRAKPARQQASRFLQLVDDQNEILPDKEDYRLAADIRAALRLIGKEIGKADPLIAACAYRRNFVLATGNVKHYGYVVDAGFALTIENWRDS